MDKRGNIYTIKGIVRAEDCNIDTGKYYQKIILQNGFGMKKNGA
jgi:hypothetical protein